MARRRSVVRRGQRTAIGVVVAVALAFVALLLIVTRAGQGGPAGAVQQAGDSAAGAAGRVATAPARSAEGFGGRLAAMWTATARIEELEAENRDLLAWKALAERLAERNARYEALLRMPQDAYGSGVDFSQAIAAQLVLDSGGPFTRTLVANAGADHGVRVGYIAVNEIGLIGRVVSVGRRSCRILMLDDYNSRIPVMGEASRVRAVLTGQATEPPELLTRPFAVETPRLEFIVGAASLREGERIITSGDGGLFPRGVPVGQARQGRDNVWRVALAASQQPIDFVRILPYAGPETPEQAPIADAGPPPPVREVARTIAPAAAAATPAPRPAPAQQAPRVQRPAPQPEAPAPAETPPPATPE